VADHGERLACFRIAYPALDGNAGQECPHDALQIDCLGGERCTAIIRMSMARLVSGRGFMNRKNQRARPLRPKTMSGT
jgi:hypothetical protein